MNPLQIIVKDICNKIKISPSIDIVSLETGSDRLEKILNQEIKNHNVECRLRLQGEFFGNGPLDHLIDDEDVTEIIINSWKDIWYEKGGKFFESQDTFLSQTTYHNYVHRLCKMLKAQLTFDQPFLCITQENFRYHIVSPSISGEDFTLSIRKHRKKRWSMNDLLEKKSLTASQFKFILGLMKDRKNFLVIGATGTGKTTFLNCCLKLLNADDRTVIIEDTSELVIPNGVSTKLLTRKDSHGLLSPIDLTILIREALRMRPDRLVLGEVRGPEAKDLLLALSTGHEGSIGTLHAVSAQEALIRLEMLIQLGAPQWSLEAIRRLIYFSLHYIICIERDEHGQRSVKNIHKISGLESFGFLLENIL
ncbi:MAG: ATPase, T2SS/T4P/T4SS family [Bdellovibrionota bacterium]